MKASKWMHPGLVTALALAATLAGCENAGKSGALLEPKHDQEQVLISWKSGTGYTIVRETEESVGSVEAVIGRAGGTVILGKNLLIVPAGAVDADTRFRMVKEDGDHVRLRLTASRYAPNDIGKRGFNRPVTLMLSYENAANLTASDISKLSVMFIRNDQMVEPLPSAVNYYDRWVGTELRHFSEYGIGWPNLRKIGGAVGGLIGGLF